MCQYTTYQVVKSLIGHLAIISDDRENIGIEGRLDETVELVEELLADIVRLAKLKNRSAPKLSALGDRAYKHLEDLARDLEREFGFVKIDLKDRKLLEEM